MCHRIHAHACRADTVVDYAAESDARAILSILAETFPHEILARTPLGCAGARRFIEDTISRRCSGCDVIWLVARDPSVVGFVEMRVSPSELFLNHIHVKPSHQGRGIGGRLLRRSIELTRPPDANVIRLSVFRDRTPQIDWYTRLSFVSVQTLRWATMSLEHGATGGWFSLSELPQADCTHSRYGFSQVVLRTLHGTYKIGRLDERFFRTHEACILEDSSALGALRAIAPGRQLVITHPGHDLGIGERFRQTHSATAVQMSAAIDEVLSRLPEG